MQCHCAIQERRLLAFNNAEAPSQVPATPERPDERMQQAQHAVDDVLRHAANAAYAPGYMAWTEKSDRSQALRPAACALLSLWDAREHPEDTTALEKAERGWEAAIGELRERVIGETYSRHEALEAVHQFLLDHPSVAPGYAQLSAVWSGPEYRALWQGSYDPRRSLFDFPADALLRLWRAQLKGDPAEVQSAEGIWQTQLAAMPRVIAIARTRADQLLREAKIPAKGPFAEERAAERTPLQEIEDYVADAHGRARDILLAFLRSGSNPEKFALADTFDIFEREYADTVRTMQSARGVAPDRMHDQFSFNADPVDDGRTHNLRDLAKEARQWARRR